MTENKFFYDEIDIRNATNTGWYSGFMTGIIISFIAVAIVKVFLIG